jgi:chromosome segregation ATPase
MIETDMHNNRSLVSDLNAQISEVDGNYLSFKSSNKSMQTQMQKLQDVFKDLSDQEREIQM